MTKLLSGQEAHFPAVLCRNHFGNNPGFEKNKKQKQICVNSWRWCARWCRSVTLGLVVMIVAELCSLHWRSAGTPPFLSWGIMGFCALPHLLWWLTGIHSGRSGTVNCALFQQISVPGLRWAMALTLYHTYQRKSFHPGITTIFLFVFVLPSLLFLSFLHPSAEHGGQADQEDKPGPGGREQQLEGAVC